MPDHILVADEPLLAESDGSGHVATVHRLHPEDEGEPGSHHGGNLVGSMLWTLEEGDVWVLASESAFLFTDCWRETLFREAVALDAHASRREALKDALRTMARRVLAGVSPLLDLYVAERDGAELAISSDELGGALYKVTPARVPLICRKTVYFGSQKGVVLEVETPLVALRRGLGWREVLAVLKRTAYGPGWVFQKFVPQQGSDEIDVILQVDGDIHHRELAPGETLRADPRHTYAWDATVGHRLVKFGSVADRMIRGSIPFQVEFEGPGRVWLSNLSFDDGYLGNVCTPSYWVYRVHSSIRNLFGFLNPLS